MRPWFLAGASILIGSTLGVACSDDDPATGGGGSGGSGGSSGSAGSAGTAGRGGSGGGAGAGGMGSAGRGGMGGSGGAGMGGSGGSSGSGSGNAGTSSTSDAGTGDAGTGLTDAGDATAAPCTGCLELRVPFTAPNETAFFQLVFGSADLSGTVATFRLRTQILDESGQLFVQTYSTDGDFTFGTGSFTNLNAAAFTDTSTFIDVPLNVGAITTDGFDDTAVIAVGLQVGTGATFTGPATVVLLLDSISYTNPPSGLANLDFTADAQGVAINAFAGLQTAEVIHH